MDYLTNHMNLKLQFISTAIEEGGEGGGRREKEKKANFTQQPKLLGFFFKNSSPDCSELITE